MWENITAYKKPNIEKLIKYGFKKKGDLYFLNTEIMENAFLLNVCVTEDDVKMKVTDKETGDEYTLAFNPDAVGAFVGQVRTECEAVMSDIITKCYDNDIFRSEYTKLVISYIKEKYNTCAEYLWENAPDNAIFRNAENGKWFAVLLTIEKRKLGIEQDGNVEIIDLKDTPESIVRLVDDKKYFKGFHMNKKHWYTVCLDGSVPIEEIYKRIDISFSEVKKK